MQPAERPFPHRRGLIIVATLATAYVASHFFRASNVTIGLDLMREIRARGHLASQLPAIALTGYAGRHDVHLVTAAGYQKHLAKPVDAATLLRTVSALVAPSKLEHPAR